MSFIWWQLECIKMHRNVKQDREKSVWVGYLYPVDEFNITASLILSEIVSGFPMSPSSCEAPCWDTRSPRH
jgi:hypothetical protein